MTDRSQNGGLLHHVMSDMPPWIKAIVSLLLVFPIVLAVSGMLLNINVGAILEEVVALSMEKQRGAMNEALDVRFTQLQDQLLAASAKTEVQFLAVQELLTEHAELLHDHSSRIEALERRVMLASERPPLPILQGDR